MNPDDLSPLYSLTVAPNTMLNGLRMSQNLIAPAAWALAILTKRPARVIEIGTMEGGFSEHLSNCCKHIGSKFYSCDIADLRKHFNYTWRKMDCFSPEGVIEINSLISADGLCFILCDGGNKPREFNEFQKMMKKGDVISAHDWMPANDVANYTPTWWGWYETHDEYLKLEGLADFMPEWFHYSAWKVCEKL